MSGAMGSLNEQHHSFPRSTSGKNLLNEPTKEAGGTMDATGRDEEAMPLWDDRMRTQSGILKKGGKLYAVKPPRARAAVTFAFDEPAGIILIQSREAVSPISPDKKDGPIVALNDAVDKCVTEPDSFTLLQSGELALQILQETNVHQVATEVDLFPNSLNESETPLKLQSNELVQQKFPEIKITVRAEIAVGALIETETVTQPQPCELVLQSMTENVVQSCNCVTNECTYQEKFVCCRCPSDAGTFVQQFDLQKHLLHCHMDYAVKKNFGCQFSPRTQCMVALGRTGSLPLFRTKSEVHDDLSDAEGNGWDISAHGSLVCGPFKPEASELRELPQSKFVGRFSPRTQQIVIAAKKLVA